jgi:hypothetical protein
MTVPCGSAGLRSALLLLRRHLHDRFHLYIWVAIKSKEIRNCILAAREGHLPELLLAMVAAAGSVLVVALHVLDAFDFCDIILPIAADGHLVVLFVEGASYINKKR